MYIYIYKHSWSYTCPWATQLEQQGSSCIESGYVNEFDVAFDYKSPSSAAASQFGYINGMYSYNDNNKEDRRYIHLVILKEKIVNSVYKKTVLIYKNIFQLILTHFNSLFFFFLFVDGSFAAVISYQNAVHFLHYLH